MAFDTFSLMIANLSFSDYSSAHYEATRQTARRSTA